MVKFLQFDVEECFSSHDYVFLLPAYIDRFDFYFYINKRLIFMFGFILKEIGEREGKFYAINVPLKDGIDDNSFTRLFKTVSNMLC